MAFCEATAREQGEGEEPTKLHDCRFQKIGSSQRGDVEAVLDLLRDEVPEWVVDRAAWNGSVT